MRASLFTFTAFSVVVSSVGCGAKGRDDDPGIVDTEAALSVSLGSISAMPRLTSPFGVTALVKPLGATLAQPLCIRDDADRLVPGYLTAADDSACSHFGFGSNRIWSINQWSKSGGVFAERDRFQLRGDNLFRPPATPTTFDSVLGKPADLAFPTPDNRSHVWVFQRPTGNIVELYGQGGTWTNGGGSNVFLAQDLLDWRHDPMGPEPDPSAWPALDFSRPIRYRISARVSKATLTKPKGLGDPNEIVWQFFSGFVLKQNASNRNAVDGRMAAWRQIYLQIGHADSRGTPTPYLDVVPNRQDTSYTVVLPQDALGNGPSLSSQPSSLARSMSFDLNDALCKALRAGRQQNPSLLNDPSLPFNTLDLTNWIVTGYYVGVETQQTKCFWPAAVGSPEYRAYFTDPSSHEVVSLDPPDCASNESAAACTSKRNAWGSKLQRTPFGVCTRGAHDYTFRNAAVGVQVSDIALERDNGKLWNSGRCAP
jgi:hypothetical protein